MMSKKLHSVKSYARSEDPCSSRFLLAVVAARGEATAHRVWTRMLRRRS